VSLPVRLSLPVKVFSLVKIFFFHAAPGRKHQWRQGATCRRKTVMKRQGGRTLSSARLRCRARRHHATGLFAALPICRKEGKQTQPVSFVEKAG
jgi:hypothetical protein